MLGELYNQVRQTEEKSELPTADSFVGSLSRVNWLRSLDIKAKCAWQPRQQVQVNVFLLLQLYLEAGLNNDRLDDRIVTHLIDNNLVTAVPSHNSSLDNYRFCAIAVFMLVQACEPFFRGHLNPSHLTSDATSLDRNRQPGTDPRAAGGDPSQGAIRGNRRVGCRK